MRDLRVFRKGLLDGKQVLFGQQKAGFKLKIPMYVCVYIYMYIYAHTYIYKKKEIFFLPWMTTRLHSTD